MRRHVQAVLAGVMVGLIVGACGPVTTTGPTAVVLKVLLNEGRGTRILYISGMDDTPVNVFPSVYRPETVSPTQLPTGETVRVLLDDSLGGTAVTFRVVGFNVDNTAVEEGSVRITVVAKHETTETVRLTLYDQGDAGMGGGAGGGTATGGGAGTGGGGAVVPCTCATSCCDLKGQCVQPVETRGAQPMRYAPAGNVGQTCVGVCNPVISNKWNAALNACGCGAGPACARGQRCDLATNQCVCDKASSCPGCCVADTCQPALGSVSQCGAAGNSCQPCQGGSSGPTCNLGVCGVCNDSSPTKCCTATDKLDTQFPTCRGLNGACEACDRSRADRCSTASNRQSGCACGSLARQCFQNQLCIVDGGAAGCVDMTVLP
jgi:hypothetical protein